MNTKDVIALLALTFGAAAIQPAPLAAQKTVNVRVTRQSDGAPIAGAGVCIGTSTNLAAQGNLATDASGNASFRTVTVVSGTLLTVSATGYIGGSIQIPINNLNPLTIPVRMTAGKGGPSCPPRDVRLSGTVTVPISPTTTTPRLGEQILPEHGVFGAYESERKTLDCKQFGTSYVMVGIIGNHGEGVDKIQVECKPARKDGTLGSSQWTQSWGGTSGTPYASQCPANKAVAGYSGTVDRGQIRSLTLRCNAITTTGLTTGSTTLASRAGGSTGTAFLPNPDSCSDGRPARALRVEKGLFASGIPGGNLFAPTVIVGAQMFCEQPVVQ